MLDQYMEQIMMSAAAMYMYVYRSTEIKLKDKMQTVDEIVKQFYVYQPASIETITDDPILIEVWTILCSDIGCNYEPE